MLFGINGKSAGFRLFKCKTHEPRGRSLSFKSQNSRQLSLSTCDWQKQLWVTFTWADAIGRPRGGGGTDAQLLQTPVEDSPASANKSSLGEKKWNVWMWTQPSKQVMQLWTRRQCGVVLFSPSNYKCTKSIRRLNPTCRDDTIMSCQEANDKQMILK